MRAQPKGTHKGCRYNQEVSVGTGLALALARATLDRVVTDGRVLPIRAAAIRRVLDAAQVTAATDPTRRTPQP